MAGSKDNDQFSRYAAAVGRELFNEPNKALSSKTELRWGDRGSMSLDIEKGTFYDHKAAEGGGVLWAIERVTGAAGRAAVEWMREKGFHIEDRDPPAHAGAQDGRSEYKPPRYDRNGNRLPERVPDHAVMTKAYEYREADGKLRYQVCRWDWDDPNHPKGHDKTFVQRRPDQSKKDGWTFSTKGVEQVPYRLPELLEAIANGEEVFIVEGEKKADMLWAEGVPATCNTGGAKKFPEALVEWFRGAMVTIIPDNDAPGEDHAKLVATRLQGVAKRVRVLRLPGLPPAGSVDDWLPAGGSADELYRLANSEAKPAETVPFESKFGAVFWQDMDEPGPAYEYLIKGVLSRGEASMVAGESRSGKTFLVLHMAMCVARGVDFFGRRVRQGGVIYQAGEGARAVRRKRLKAYRKHFDCAGEPVPFVLMESPIDLYSADEQADAFIDEVRSINRRLGQPAELIVIDTFSKATPGINENDSADIGKVLERCDRIRRATGAHVMLVHHMNAEGAKPRGHTSLLANVETVIITRKVPDHHDGKFQIREWELSKQKEGADNVKARFILPEVEIGVDEDGDPVTSCVVALPSTSKAAQEEKPDGIQLGDAARKVLRTIYDVIEKDGILAPVELGLPFGTLVANRAAIPARFADTEAPDDPETLDETAKAAHDAAVRQRLKRGRDLLYNRKIIDMRGEFVWLTGTRVMGFGPPPGTKRHTPKAKEDEGPRDDLPFADDFDMKDFR